MSFLDQFQRLHEEKDTILCVGLDPALPRQRKQKIIPKKYMDSDDENEARLTFCLDIIDAVQDYSVAMKPNQQYIFGFTKEQHKQLTDSISKASMLSILDYKLNDIGETIKSAIFHIAEVGYDAITFNPLPGNLEEAVNFAHQVNEWRGSELGIIVLTLMSNPEAILFMKNSKVGKNPFFKIIAEQIKTYNADGCVVGATDHISTNDIKKIRRITGSDKIFLIPGIGAQKGNIRKTLKVSGKNTLINVSRDIIYSKNPHKKAKEYYTIFNANRLHSHG
jgi:orotidine 5'-phosphate decarboxylase subfamily 2